MPSIIIWLSFLIFSIQYLQFMSPESNKDISATFKSPFNRKKPIQMLQHSFCILFILPFYLKDIKLNDAFPYYRSVPEK